MFDLIGIVIALRLAGLIEVMLFGSSVGLTFVVAIAAILAFSFKDGFSGHSPGKFLLGVQVIHAKTMEPIGFGTSFRRNLPILAIQCGFFIPQAIDEALGYPFGFGNVFAVANFVGLILLLIMAYQLNRGPRWGDGLANTKVVWKKHRFRVPFDTRGRFCQKCGYDLSGLTENRCPECFTEFEPSTLPHE